MFILILVLIAGVDALNDRVERNGGF